MADDQQILNKIKNKVCIEKRYRLSDHATDYIFKRQSSRDDIEYCIENAEKINEEKKDRMNTAIDGRIYTIKGFNRAEIGFYTTGKFIKDNDNKEEYFFVTAHQYEEIK